MVATSPATKQTARLAGWIALAAAALTVGLIVFGSWVRASGSGLGCPDWPLCHGNVVPQLEGDTAIEFGHRFYAGIVMLTVAAGTVVAYRARPRDRTLFRLLAAALGVILFQAVLGGITVLTELHGAVRFAHLLTAMATLSLLTAAAAEGLGIRPRIPRGLAIPSVLLVVNIAVMVMGGLIVWWNVGPGCPGLPLCDERSTTTTAVLHGLHRTTAILLALALLAFAVRLMRRRDGSPFVTGVNHAAAFLAVSQIAIGVLAVINTLPEGLRVLHVAVATLIWWMVVTLWILAYRARAR